MYLIREVDDTYVAVVDGKRTVFNTNILETMLNNTYGSASDLNDRNSWRSHILPLELFF